MGFEGTGVLQNGDGAANTTQLDELDQIARAQHDKNWKEKRERPPAEIAAASAAAAAAAANPGAAMITGAGNNPTHPADLHHFPGMFNTRINHNSHAGQNPMTKYDQEITYWNYIHPEVLTALQNGRQGKVRAHKQQRHMVRARQQPAVHRSATGTAFECDCVSFSVC